MKFDKHDKVVKAPNGLNNPLYKLTKAVVKAAKIKNSLVGTKEEVLAKATKMNAKNRHFIMPTDNKAHYTDHLIQGQYHCVEIDIEKARRKNAILFVFGGGMILGSDKGDIGLSRKIAEKTGSDVWFPYYPLCYEHDVLENVQMIFECYEKMLTFYKSENIVFLGFSSGGALILDLITYINELNDSGRNIPMPGMLIPISPGSVPVTEAERSAINRLDKRDIMIPAEYMYSAREIMCHGRDIPEIYLATAHGDFRNAPMTHFYYGSAETLYAFAPSYAESYRKAGAKCVIHVGKGMHHCYALQYFIPGCKPAFDEIMGLINHFFKSKKGVLSMSANYKNWVPNGMITALTAGTAVLGAGTATLMFTKMNPKAKKAFVATAGAGTLVCGAMTAWSIYAHSKFSYDGKRQLSKEIVEGTAEFITLPEGGIGLDVGCGSGALTIACARRNPQGRMIGIDRWGMEYASFSQQLCEDNSDAEGVNNTEFHQGDACKLDYPDEYFDAVTSNYVYHNIAGVNKQELLRETLRVLKKGGTFAIHDIMSKARYGDMQQFISELYDEGYEVAELIDTTDGMFMTKGEAKILGLSGSALLIGRK